jgi:hypothetical protein
LRRATIGNVEITMRHCGAVTAQSGGCIAGNGLMHASPSPVSCSWCLAAARSISEGTDEHDYSAHISLLALADPTLPDHYTVAIHAMSIAKTRNPAAAEIMKERSNQSIQTSPAARA